MHKIVASLMHRLFLILILSLPFVLTGQTAAREVPRKSSLCYAFLRDGDLWTVCQGRREQANLREKIMDFAISEDGANLAIQERGTASADPSAPEKYYVVLIPLNGTRRVMMQVEAPGSLRRSCGTLILFDYLEEHATDLLMSAEVQSPPYQYFLCSSNRQVTAGWTEQDAAEYGKNARESINAVPSFTIARPGRQSRFKMYDAHAFDVSPGGTFVAFFAPFLEHPKKRSGPDLCLSGVATYPSCVPGGGLQISVSDQGDVIYWNAGDALSELRYWHVGEPKTTLLEKDADHPQWITPEAASALHLWNTQREASQKKSEREQSR